MTDKKEIIFYVVFLIVVLLTTSHLNVIVSGSMEPVFHRGDIVVVEKADFFGLHEFDPSVVQVGDIIVYKALWYNNPVIHRIINITEINGTTLYMIKGDNNNVPDPYYVKSEQITDKVVTFGDNPAVIPKIGYFTIFLKGL